ncbi:hypothetical protein [Dokdonella immobilis]|uniref:Uncharacterized protein n=1 Tax=Dokdonella immobilis TaxID=578942 RepID=A0A1I4XLV1_9GAMM|nr:hypothetical protein [Dokdonella immobilis]SFN26259.1 hypothetical protein SAMN05216289_11082 [Dokdonella immobilis]
MNVRNARFSVFSAAVALILALFVAPSAYARGGHHGGHHGGHGSNWGVSIGFAGPGYSIGYSDCRHCGGGYVSGSFYGGYYGGGYPVGYYGPSYSSSYYDYYPSYGTSYYYSYPAYYPSYRHYRHAPRRVVHYDGYYRDHDRGRDHRRHDGYRGDSRHHDRDYSRHDRGYSSRAAYYDRRN